MKLILFATVPLVAAAAYFFGSSAFVPDDRSFFMAPDRNDWPGDDLSYKQYGDAVDHFKVKDACRKPWRWALIGPNRWLLKGTDYMLVRVPGGGPYIANVHYSRGYWGGTNLLVMSVLAGKATVEVQARDDCLFGDPTPMRNRNGPDAS